MVGEKEDGKSGRTVAVFHGGVPTASHFGGIIPAVRATAFWSAVCLPWVALAFLFTGLATRFPLVFTGLVTVAFLSAVVGHEYTHR